MITSVHGKSMYAINKNKSFMVSPETDDSSYLLTSWPLAALEKPVTIKYCQTLLNKQYQLIRKYCSITSF